VFQQNASFIPGSNPAMRMVKADDVKCPHPYTVPVSPYCFARVYSEKAHNSFTPACCNDGYKGSTALYTSIAHPIFKSYVGDCSGADPTRPPKASAAAPVTGRDAAINSGNALIGVPLSAVLPLAILQIFWAVIFS
jgi:hypothetical protein